MTFYIYLKNELPNEQTLSCFLGSAQELLGASLYYYSDVLATLPTASDSRVDLWTLTDTPSLLATASIHPLGPTRVEQSTVREPAQKGETWEAQYYQNPEQRKGPTLHLLSAEPAAPLTVHTNAFDQAQEPLNDWYGGLGWALDTPVGRLRQLWSPAPRSIYQLDTTLSFYVYKGFYSAETYILASTVAASAQLVTLDDLDDQGRCTVTLSSSGLFSIQAGPPS